MTWDDLQFWSSGEYQVIEERLKDLDKAGISWNPGKDNIWAAMDATKLEDVKVAFIGQDPYPKSKHSTGIAFDIPKDEKDWPPTLVNVLAELFNDLGVEHTSPSLTKWTQQGVFLWNATPTCLTGKPGSHSGWSEYELLNKEICEELDKRNVIFVMMGAKAQKLLAYTKAVNTIFTSHPSPLGAYKTKLPFMGSKIFSRINLLLKEPLDWRL